MNTRALFCALLLTWPALGAPGCSSAPEDGGTPADAARLDGGAAEDAGGDADGSARDGFTSGDDAATAPGLVEVGIGQDMFEPVTTGQAVPMAIGPQAGADRGRLNGHHIWSALRARGLDPSRVRVTFQLFDAATRELRAEQTRETPLEPSGDAHVAYGFAPRISDCCLVEDRDVIIRVEVTDRDGLSGSDERTIHAGRCLDGGGRLVCP